MKEYLVTTVDGEMDHIVGEAMLDLFKNALVIDYIHGGTRTYYWPNVISFVEQEYDESADDDE